MKKILLAIPELPLLKNHGGSVDYYNTILSLNKLSGYILDVVCTFDACYSSRDIALLNELVSGDIYLVKRKHGIFSFLHFIPYQCVSRRGLSSIALGHYDLVFLQGEYSLPVLKSLPKNSHNKVFLRVNNDESDYMHQLSIAASNPLKKLYLFVESIKWKYYQRSITNNFDAAFFVSKNNLKSSSYNCSRYHLPPFIDFKSASEYSNSLNFNCLFVGSLFMDNNLYGLKWYLDNVHPLLIHKFPDYHLHIAGSYRGAASDFDYITDYGSVSLHINISDSDLMYLYSSSQVFVSPMFFGSGVKVKNLNAVLQNIPIVATIVSAEGMDFVSGEHLFSTDDANEFFKYISLLFMDKIVHKNMASNAFNFLQSTYDTSYQNFSELFL